MHNTGEVGAPVSATYETHHTSSGSTIGSISRNIYDSFNSKFGKDQMQDGLSGTSTRGGHDFNSFNNNNSGTSFR